MPPALFSLNFFGFSGLLWFHVHLRIACSISVKNGTGILIGLTLNVQSALGSVDILTVLSSNPCIQTILPFVLSNLFHQSL